MTPDLATSHVEGLRIFRLNPRTLMLESLTNNGGDPTWKPGEIQRSVCGVLPQNSPHGPFHVKPEIDCTCGIWSCKNRRGIARAFPVFMQPPSSVFPLRNPYIDFTKKTPLFVSARIEQWGVVIEHESGYRSEYARIIPDTIQVFPRTRLNKRYDRVIRYLREKYDPRPT